MGGERPVLHVWSVIHIGDVDQRRDKQVNRETREMKCNGLLKFRRQ